MDRENLNLQYRWSEDEALALPLRGWCERDPTTRRLLVEILADTERHASE